MRTRARFELFKHFKRNFNRARQKCSCQMTAVSAALTAKGARFGFLTVASSSEHEKATPREMESPVLQGLNRIKI